MGFDRVRVPATLARAREVAPDHELDDDAVDGPLSDADRLSDFAQADAGVLGDADEHPSVVGQERPRGASVSRHLFLDSIIV